MAVFHEPVLPKLYLDEGLREKPTNSRVDHDVCVGGL